MWEPISLTQATLYALCQLPSQVENLGHSLSVPWGTYINHCAAGLEGEDDVDVGAIGHSSAGVVGQEELQATNQLPGDTHFNGVGLAQHGDCEREGILLEHETWLGGKASRGVLSPSHNLHFLFLPPGKGLKQIDEHNWDH